MGAFADVHDSHFSPSTMIKYELLIITFARYSAHMLGHT